MRGTLQIVSDLANGQSNIIAFFLHRKEDCSKMMFSVLEKVVVNEVKVTEERIISGISFSAHLCAGFVKRSQ